MGGDFGPSVVVPAALIALDKNPSLALTLVGDEHEIRKHLHQHKAENHTRLSIKHATQVVTMDESPAHALRNKKDSSMRVAINLVKEKTVKACISAGNTGALMGTAKFVLKTIPGIDRPAIITGFPTVVIDKTVRVLDLGGNVDCSPEHLLQFAVMGSIVASAVDYIDKPKVGLLNIGSEAIKGNEQVKKASALLASHPHLNFMGNIEADQIYMGNTDVIVCDGFVGNVALKASEGAVALILHYLRHSFAKNFITKMIGAFAKPVLMNLKDQIDPTNFNGACFVGLKGIVVKSHGGANVEAFANAINETILLVAQNVPEQIELRISSLLESQDNL